MDVWADKRLLQMVLTKLLSNALKFVPSDRKPHIRIWTESAPVTGEVMGVAPVRLQVQDNGVGIAPEYHERVFGLFQRLRQDESDESRGIGLAIVQAAIERMDGVVGVASAPGQGSTFWVELAGVASEAWQKGLWEPGETQGNRARLSRGHMRLAGAAN